MAVNPSTPSPRGRNHRPGSTTDRSVGDHAATPRPPSASAISPSSGVLRSQLAKRPWVTLGVFAATGFALGGGVTSPALQGVARLGARFALAVAVRQLGTVMTAPAPTSSWPA